MKLIPTKGRIVVEDCNKEMDEVKSAAGLIIATSQDEVASEEIIKARVISGSESYKDGLIVYVSRYSSLPMKDNKTGKTYMIVPETDVVAIEGDEAEYDGE